MTTPEGNQPRNPGAPLQPNPDEVNNFHQYDDTDDAPTSHHHTLGIDQNQASPGNHNHDGKNSKGIAGGGGGQVLATGNNAPVTFTAPRSSFVVNAVGYFNSGHTGSYQLGVAGAIPQNGVNTIVIGGNASGAQPQTSSASKAYTCNPGDVITITPSGFSGTIDESYWNVVG